MKHGSQARGRRRAGKRSALACAALAVLALLAAAPAEAAGTEDMIAPLTACPGQTEADASAAVQESAMLCMTNFARRQAGRAGFSDAKVLARSAVRKSEDILRCNAFSHTACGRSFTYWIQRSGYFSANCWRAAENIAWGTGKLGTVRSILTAWLNSPGHRENILGRYAQIGIGLRLGQLDDHADAHVWTQHFGSHC